MASETADRTHPNVTLAVLTLGGSSPTETPEVTAPEGAQA
jgi:hypothetical protein